MHLAHPKRRAASPPRLLLVFRLLLTLVHQATERVEPKSVALKKRRVADITRDDLASLFHLPAELACRELGIGLTVLKRRAREVGIQRWPFRKMKSLERLIEHVVSVVAEPEARSTELMGVKADLVDGIIADVDQNTKRQLQASFKAKWRLQAEAALRLLPLPTTESRAGSVIKDEDDNTPLKPVQEATGLTILATAAVITNLL